VSNFDPIFTKEPAQASPPDASSPLNDSKKETKSGVSEAKDIKPSRGHVAQATISPTVDSDDDDVPDVFADFTFGTLSLTALVCSCSLV
jgi:hypothetical protein